MKHSTAAAHEALERQIGAITSRGAYVAYLRGLHAFRAPLERALSLMTSDDRFGAWRPCEIAPLLLADLHDLNEPPLPAESTIALSSPCTAFGALYVLEGSALGARLLKIMARDLGYDGANGARHLEKQAASLENWRAFVTLIETTPRLDIDQAVGGANAAFRAAERAFSQTAAYA